MAGQSRGAPLEILRLGPEGWTIVQVLTGRAPVRAEPFDAVELDLGALWTLSSERPADDEPFNKVLGVSPGSLPALLKAYRGMQHFR